jgi:hypothetical protein
LFGFEAMPCSRCEIAFHFRLKPTFMHGLCTTHFLVLIYIYVHVIQSRVYSSSEVSIHVEVHIPRSWSSSKWWQSGIGGGEFLLALGTVGFFYCYVDQTLKCFQRAREIYLKDWNQQRQRLPDNRCNIFSVVLLLCLQLI